MVLGPLARPPRLYDLIEAGYYGDLETGEIIDGDALNPLTGEMIRPAHYLSPQKLVFTTELTVEPAGAPLPPDLGFRGRITRPDCKRGRIWMSEELYVDAPAHQGEAARRISNSLANFEASLSDVAAQSGFVPATFEYTTLNSYRPWMNMGDARGSVVMRLNAVKLETLEEAPAPLRARIIADHPGQFVDD